MRGLGQGKGRLQHSRHSAGRLVRRAGCWVDLQELGMSLGLVGTSEAPLTGLVTYRVAG